MDFKIPLWEHQKKGLLLSKDLNAFGYFFEPGCGKTATAINFWRIKCNIDQKRYKVLVFCPPVVRENWRREFLMHSNVKGSEISILSGNANNRIKLSKNPNTLIHITNYESLNMSPVQAALNEGKYDLIIYDESHKCKDINAKRTKASIGLARKAKYKLLLTGTPVLNSPMDLFSQFYILDDGETFGKNFFIFRNTYFYDQNANMPKANHFPKWVAKPQAVEAIKRRIESKTMSVKKLDCLDLPPLVKTQRFVELGPDQRLAYNEMKRDFITSIEGKGFAVADFAMTKVLRLQQILSGFLNLDNGEEKELFSFKENPRLEALHDLLEELAPENKIIVWCVFRNNYQTVRKTCEALKLPYVELHGEVNEKDRITNIDSFNTDPNVRVLIGHPGSGGIGVNLTSASYSIWYSRGYSLEHDLQAEARNYRGGSEVHQKITRIDLIANNTVDEIIYQKLLSKQKLSDELIHEMVEELKNENS